MLIASSKERQITAPMVPGRSCLCAILAETRFREIRVMGLEIPLTLGWSTASPERDRNKKEFTCIKPGQTFALPCKVRKISYARGDPGTVTWEEKKCQEEDLVTADGLP